MCNKLAVLILLSFTLLVNGQVYYSIVIGTVRDQSGSVIPDAKVTATEVNTGIFSSVNTNEAGDYRIATLRPGRYTISVEKQSFKSKTVEGIELLVGETSRVDVPLEVGDMVQKVVVEGATPLVQTDTAERGIVMQHEEVEALPLNQRNVTELTYLLPGAIRSSTYNEPVPDVNGLGATRNQYYVDGGGSTSVYEGQPVERVSVDTVQEFKVETALMTADRGMHAGSIISVATKSGTNRLHGVLYEFFRNNVLDARNFFALTPPPLRYNQFGGTLGGPILKNKLFFQVNYEGSRNREARVFITTVPTAAERQGIFTPGTGAKNATIFDPLSIDSATGLRTPFANNQVPQSRINPLALQFLQFWPQPKTSGAINNFPFNGPATNDFDRWAIRMDYHLNEKNTFLFRYGHQSNPYLNPGPIPGAATGSRGDQATGRTMVAAWNHAFSPTMFNELRVSFANDDTTAFPSEFFGVNMTEKLGFSNGSRVLPNDYGLPGVGFSNVPTAGVGGGSIALFPNQTQYYQDDFTFNRGRHTFKTGGQFVHFAAQGFFASPGGVIQSFSGLYTSQINNLSGGQPFADFLLGALGGVSIVQSAEAAYYNRNLYQVYFMDDWKVNSRLTLQLGLRYDMNNPATSANGESAGWVDGLESRNGQVAVFPANAKGPLEKALAGTSLGFPYKISDNNWLWHPNWTSIQPRIGVAWRPFDNNRTVVRGGWGLFYDANIQVGTTDFNFGRPFYVFSATPPPASQFTAPPYTFGNVPTLTVGFAPGQQYRSGYTSFPNIPDARIQQWNFTIQRDLGHGFVVDGAYVGNHLVNGQTFAIFNRLYPIGYTFHYADGSTYTVQSTDPNVQKQIYPALGRGTSGLSWIHSTYNAAQFYLNKRMAYGLQFRVGYTRMHLYGTDGDWQDELVAQSLNYPLSSNEPNNFFATYVWELPGRNLKGLLGAVIGGWRASGIINVVSGPGVYSDTIPTIPGKTNGVEQQPRLLHDPNLPSSQRTPQRWFDTTAFAAPFPNAFGDASAIYAIRADGTRNVNAGFSKFFRIREGHRLQFRGEFFNLFNRTQFGAPAARFGLANYGQVTSAAPARQIQLGLKYEF